MCRAEDQHQDHRRQIPQPQRRAQIIEDRENDQRQRDQQERALQQRDLPSAEKIADPYSVIQGQKADRQPEPDALRADRLAADKQHDGEQISDAAALLYELHPAGDGCGRPRLSGRREGGIGEIDEHRQRKDHQPDPGERYLQIHRTTPAFTANSGSFAGLPWMAISARNSRRKASRSSDSVRCRWSVFARIASP